MKTNLKETKNLQQKGITLIALVITIIVLLILAGVAIATLSGNNSAPQKATEAAQKDAIAGAKDEIAMEAQEALLNYYNNKYVSKTSTGASGQADVQSVVAGAADTAVTNAKSRNKELLSSSGVNKETNVITLETKSFTVTGTIDTNGGITWSDSNSQGGGASGGDGQGSGGTAQAITVPAADSTFAALSNEKNVKVKDANNKKVIVPVGFRISPNSATTIEQGIVIEDENKNEFVWVPVGTEVTYSSAYNSSTLKTALKETATSGTITLARYDFGTKDARKQDIKTGTDIIYNYYTENATKFTVGNMTYEASLAKNITNFINQSNAAGGYYIGRYEMGQGKVCKSGQVVDYHLTMSEALGHAQGMYIDTQTKGKFTCDLVNSYAWDTAIVYIEKCGANSNYAFQNALKTSQDPCSTGESGDEQCKINDMASNTQEWTTENCSFSTSYYYYPYTSRGGDHGGSSVASQHFSNQNNRSSYSIGFRPILYVSSTES